MRLRIDIDPSGFLFKLLARVFGLRRKPLPMAAAGGAAVETRPGRMRLIAGLDFGTYSTKILVRHSGERTSKLVLIDQPGSEYPSIVAPSLVRIAGDKIFFGAEAYALAEGKLYRYLKKELLPGISWTRSGPGPDVLIAAYLAWALGQTKEFCDYQFGKDAYDLVFQLAAPMSNLENEALKRRYLKIAGAAWIAVFGAGIAAPRQGESASQVLRFLEQELSKGVAPSGHVQLLPETIAPIVSLGQNKLLADGIYLVIDMGSGTTELSVNEVRSADKSIICYFDQSIELGDLQFKDAFNLDKRIEELMKEVRRTWREGYEAATEKAMWSSLHVLLAGGGVQRSAVRGAIERDHRNVMYPWPAISDTNYSVDIHWPVGIDHNGAGEKALYKHGFLFAVAHGLTFERSEWPIVFR